MVNEAGLSRKPRALAREGSFMKYLYGPVASRRFGVSLGISLTPYKVCSFDCVYCQLGKTTFKTVVRKEYVSSQEVLDELKTWFVNYPQVVKKLDYLTFSGSGEPTLNARIGWLIAQIKELAKIPIVLLSNSADFIEKQARQEVLGVDIIAPSLDAVTQDLFERIDRPVPGIKVDAIIEGLVALRNEFSGKIWLEVMLIKGVNEGQEHIDKLKAAIERINPDRVQLNSPVRATSEPNILCVDKNRLEEIKAFLGGKCEIV